MKLMDKVIDVMTFRSRLNRASMLVKSMPSDQLRTIVGTAGTTTPIWQAAQREIELRTLRALEKAMLSRKRECEICEGQFVPKHMTQRACLECQVAFPFLS